MTRNQSFTLDIGWPTLLKDPGLHAGRLLGKAGLPEDLFSRSHYRLATVEYLRFWRVLEGEVNDPMLPLRMVETVSAESFNPPLFAALCSANLMQAVQRLAKYKQLLAPMILEIHVGEAGDMTISPRWMTRPIDVPYSLQMSEIAFFIRLVRMATREPVQAMSVSSPTLPPSGYVRRYEKFFGAAVQSAREPSITFAARDALRPFLTLNEGMWRVFEPDLRRRLSALDDTASTSERVRAVLLELLPSNAATIEKTSERLGMSKRTLQRRLGDEGGNFRGLVSATRMGFAQHYLTRTKMSGGEIAFLLGFEDPTSFYRAFQDWTGQTANSARQDMLLN